MKIICKKGYDAKLALQLVAEYIEKKSREYPLLDEDMEINISLCGADGDACPENEQTICFGKREMKMAKAFEAVSEDDYSRDAVTGLYNRGKYERDLEFFRVTGYTCLACMYIDAVGLHEINNHLGHKSGDNMLCTIADALRTQMLGNFAYRIGGDEFVVLWPEHTQDEIAEKLSILKQAIRESGYEISAGIGESTDSKTLDEIINYAESAMRSDKMDFYRNNGGLRQVRSLNHKLEKLLLEKQDANHFLNVIAPRYKGVYIVNSEKDTCRYIYVPPYFQKMLEDNHGVFSSSIKDYCYTLVRPEYYEQFEKLFDYHYIQEQLDAGDAVNFTYQKTDDNWVELKITIYDQEASDLQEMLWIFLTE